MELGDALWVASGGQGSGVEVYVQKVLLGMAYQEAELFMLTDFSPGACQLLNLLLSEIEHGPKIFRHVTSVDGGLVTGFSNTWAFLERRLEGAERMKSSAQEVGWGVWDRKKRVHLSY